MSVKNHNLIYFAWAMVALIAFAAGIYIGKGQIDEPSAVVESPSAE